MPFDFCPTALASCKEFLIAHQEALQSAARLLGGPCAARRADRLVLGLCEASGLSLRLRTELDWLHGLLTLKNVADFGSTEAAQFALIDPASPVVEEICLLADTLQGHLQELDRRVG